MICFSACSSSVESRPQSAALDVLPARIQTTAGGRPRVRTSSTRSRSFVSSTALARRAASKTSISVASRSLSLRSEHAKHAGASRASSPPWATSGRQSRSHARMQDSCGPIWRFKKVNRIRETCIYVFGFKVWELDQDLLLRKPTGEKLQHVDHSNAHVTNARPAATLRRILRDSIECFAHRSQYMRRLPANASGTSTSTCSSSQTAPKARSSPPRPRRCRRWCRRHTPPAASLPAAAATSTPARFPRPGHRHP